jgi:hypothetical protein
MLAMRQCWLCANANAGCAPMLAVRQCWLCANAGCAPMLAMRQCWLCANAGYAPMLAVCQCWLCANAGYAPMMAMGQCWLCDNAAAPNNVVHEPCYHFDTTDCCREPCHIRINQVLKFLIQNSFGCVSVISFKSHSRIYFQQSWSTTKSNIIGSYYGY